MITHLALCEGSNPGALPPPTSPCNPFSVRSAGHEKRRFPGAFEVNLLTARGQRRKKSALWGPDVSGPVDWRDLVRFLKAATIQ